VFAQHFIDQAELVESFRGNAHGLRRDLFLVGAFPEIDAQPSGEMTE
jgi:hypothetical protein